MGKVYRPNFGKYSALIQASRERTAAMDFDDLLDGSGVTAEGGFLRSTDHESDSDKAKLTPQLTLQVIQQNGPRLNLPWHHYQGTVMHTSGEVFLEVIFLHYHIVVFGRNLNQLMGFLKQEAIRDLAENSPPDDDSLPYFVRKVLVIIEESTDSLFLDDSADRRTLEEFVLKNPLVKLRRPDALEVTTALIMPPELQPEPEGIVRDP